MIFSPDLNNTLVGRPVAWSDPSLEEFESSFGLCMEALKSVLGYSDADVYVEYSGMFIDLVPRKPGSRRQGAFYGRKKHLKDRGELGGNRLSHYILSKYKPEYFFFFIFLSQKYAGEIE